MLYKHLKGNYGEGEPIMLNEISVDGMSNVNLRQQIKKLVDSGRLKRYDTGIYFISEKSIFASGMQLSKEKVIEQKYLRDQSGVCGYLSGMLFANSIGITSQIPLVYELVTNKATNDYREIILAGSRVVIRKPKVRINDENCKVLQFMEMLKDIDVFSALEGRELTEKLLGYMHAVGIGFRDIDKYLEYFPDKIFKNMYRAGLIGGKEEP